MKKSKTTKKKVNTSDSQLKNYVKIQLLNFGVFAVVYLISSLISLFVGVKPAAIIVISVITFSLSSFICAYIAAFRNRKNGIYTGVLSVLLQIFVFEFISVIINKFSIDYNIIITALLMIVSAAVGGIAGVNTRLKPKMKRGK